MSISTRVRTVVLVTMLFTMLFGAGNAHAALSAKPAPCDGLGDCFFTVVWWAFLR